MRQETLVLFWKLVTIGKPPGGLPQGSMDLQAVLECFVTLAVWFRQDSQDSEVKWDRKSLDVFSHLEDISLLPILCTLSIKNSPNIAWVSQKFFLFVFVLF